MTVAEWVRQSLREARMARQSVAEAKLRAVDEATRHSFPVGDIEAMLRENRGRPVAGVIFVDSNVPMYLVGAEHPNKVRVRELLGQFIRRNEHLVTDIEVYQEVLHRYASIHRHDAIDPAIASLDAIADEVLPIDIADVRAARVGRWHPPGIRCMPP